MEESPQVSRNFQIKGPLLDSWNMMNDLQTLGGCIPGCEEVKVLSDTESRWKLKISVGVISRKIEAKVKVTLKEAPSRLILRIESVEGDINGEFQLVMTEHDQETTDVAFNASLDARGPFRWIVNQVISGQMDKFVGQFAECVSARLSNA